MPPNTPQCTPEVRLVYDRECPACNAYCQRVRIGEGRGTLALIDARQRSTVMEKITRKGWDIDQGMVLEVDGTLYYGADAIHALSLLSNQTGAFNRINHWIFRSGARARVLYPLLRAGRNLLLKLLRKTKVNNLGVAGNERF